MRDVHEIRQAVEALKQDNHSIRQDNMLVRQDNLLLRQELEKQRSETARQFDEMKAVNERRYHEIQQIAAARKSTRVPSTTEALIAGAVVSVACASLGKLV